jgi:hypothetical protein
MGQILRGRQQAVTDPMEILARYRWHLFDEGREIEPCELTGKPGRKGLSPEAVEEVRRKGGKLSNFEFLRQRVRHFCDGAVIGTKDWVEEQFMQFRETHFPPSRQTGARPMRKMPKEDRLFTWRDLSA